MSLKAKVINNVLVALLVVATFGLVAMYEDIVQQKHQIQSLTEKLLEKENQIVVSNEALSYTRYQHQLLAEDYSRFRDEQSMKSVLSQ
ncbi:hypothetical protein QTO01_12490 [Vibrio mytili]|uniref:Uncharacterized protein n=1 Tax=Vibrio mytili TaxID=50718 RepID=A0A0C3IA87_9VIBR|nr:hypothetical protein [Vibrio mytili]KIN11910.1 hypothetical protein SU60_05230 [Vibrio mytili]